MDNSEPVTPKRRSCVACTGVKMKCTPHPVTPNLCQRCARLGKSCTYLDLPQRKRRRKATPSRVEALEKVGQSTSQLFALTRQQNEQITHDAPNPLTNTTSSSREVELDSTDTSIVALLDAANDPSHGPDPPVGSILAGEPSIIDLGLLSEAEAERLLAKFQLEFVPKFPFALIAHGETAIGIKDREPFLFLCIVAATMGSAHPLRKTVTEEIMKHVTLRLVARSERNLELLRGLLIHSTWYFYPAERHHPRLLLFIQFCVSICHDLGLHKKPKLNAGEERALLGTYWLSVGFCGTLGRPVTMKHDGRINDCIEKMALTGNLSDRWIAPFIHLQSFLAIMDEAYASMQRSDGMPLIQVTCGSLRRQFESMRASVDKDISNCPLSTGNALRPEVKYVEMRLEEVSLREELWTVEPSSTTRTKMLMGMIYRGKELIQMIINLPATEIAQVTILTSAHICAAIGYMASAVLTLLKLISGPDTAAQTQAIVDAADYHNLVTQLASVLESRCEGMSAAEKELDVVGSLCSKMRQLARGYPYQVKAAVGSASSTHAQDKMQDTSMMVSANSEVVPVAPQAWPFFNVDSGDMFSVDDTHWESLLSNFTDFSYQG